MSHAHHPRFCRASAWGLWRWRTHRTTPPACPPRSSMPRERPQARSIIPVAVHQAHFVAGTLRRASGIPTIAAEAAIRPAAPLPARARRSQLVPCPAPSYKQSHESTRAGASRSSEARAYPIRATPPAEHLASPADSTPRSSTAIAHRGIFVSQPCCCAPAGVLALHKIDNTTGKFRAARVLCPGAGVAGI